ncbi:MAG: fumarylacetoacetate hydrolase family protein [Nocardioides sp.]|nr:fumarylacetoacetate hydrolase family protein [Nocardioidaceae bacterium]MCB8958595.1 fumarylacetoacetate hydrolase family protein [Nocardioides sp.]
MSTNVARTSDGWWVVGGEAATPVATSATSTAELLADRDAVAAAAASSKGAVPVADLQLLSPVTTPARVVAQMVNYRSHAHDSGFDPDSVPPTFFRKASTSVTGPTGDIRRPDHVRFLDYEVELGLVMGAALPLGTEVSEDDLHEYVAGLVVTNDVSAREIQLTRTQFYESKSYPSFTPTGPYLTLVDRDELRRLSSLRLRLSVNGEVRQDSSVAEMIVRPARALTLLARFQQLAPGDLLLTGTPGGTALKAPPMIVEKIGALLPPKVKWKVFFDKQESNPRYLRDGDVVSARIATPDGAIDLGSQHNQVTVAS